MEMLGKLEPVAIRKVWKLETDFSAWLAQEENLKQLGDAVGIDILEGEAEAGVGDFRADILAQEDGSDRRIIVETQYGDTDHKHLGQIITYAAGTKAQILIWVVENARDEHRAAIQWLNEHTPEEIGVFLVKIDIFKIGNSAPAPSFTILERPNTWIKTSRKSTSDSAASQRYYQWWDAFLKYTDAHSAYKKIVGKRTAAGRHFMDFGLGSSQYHIDICATLKHGLSVGIWINNNKELFNHFHAQKDQIEAELGFSMEWFYLEGKQASRIDVYRKADISDTANAADHFKWYCEHIAALKRVFPKYAP